MTENRCDRRVARRHKESIMASSSPAVIERPDQDVARTEALRWVRKKRILYTILGIYAVLSLMWFTIDMADGTENLWFYWPMLGTGAVVAVTAVIMVGIGGLFGPEWERRQVQRYLDQHG
jgi:hypothetical protein